MVVRGHGTDPGPLGHCLPQGEAGAALRGQCRLHPGSPESSQAAGCRQRHQATVPRVDRKAKLTIPLTVPSTLARAGLEGLSAASVPHPKALIPSEPLGVTPLPPQVKSWVDPAQIIPCAQYQLLSQGGAPAFFILVSDY